MTHKIISFIFVISLAFGFVNINQVKDVPFDVNEVINQVSLPTGEFLIDTSITYIFTCGRKYSPSMVFDGTNYLVVWSDGRTGQWRIYGTRVSQTGIILDPAGILISNAIYNQGDPSVAFDGTNYLVVWHDHRAGYSRSDIYGARVSQLGVVLDTNGFPISATTYDEENPSVVFDGTNYLVVWNDHRNGNCDVYGARVNQEGIVLDPNGIAMATAADYQSGPEIAFDGTNYLVVWNDKRNGNYDIYGTRVNQEGIVLDPNGIAISVRPDFQACPAVAFDGTNYLVVWEDNRSGTSEDDIYGTLVNQAGIVLDTIGVTISNATHRQTEPSVGFDGLNYFVVWCDFRHHNSNFYFSNIYGTRVTQSVKVFDTLGIAISDTTNSHGVACIAFGDSNYLVVGSAAPSRGDNNVYGLQVTPSGTILDPDGFAISTAANDQYSPSVAFDGTNYLLVWHDYRKIFECPFNCEIYGTRISQTGIVMDPYGINITAETSHQDCPSVAFDGTNYLVVWRDVRNGNSDIYGARVSKTGIVLDPAGIAISTATYNQSDPTIAFDGTNCLVVWEDYRYDPISDIYGARVNQSGTVLDPEGIAISTARYDQIFPSIAFDDTNYFVVWFDSRNIYAIFGSRVSQAGTVLEPDGIFISNAEGYSTPSPSVAFDGTNYLVVWDDDDIYGARVNLSGIVLDTNSIVITNDTILQGEASIGFDGTNYLVVWQDYRNDPFSWDLYGARVNPSGSVIDTFAVSLQPGNQRSPTLVHGPGNQMLITYTSWTESINGNPANAMRIWGKFYPFVPGIEEDSKVKMPSSKLLEVYPNPAKSFLTVRLPLIVDRQPLKIFDVAGKLVKVEEKVTSLQEHKQEIRISLKGINPGIYFLRVGKETKKFIVTR